jgi:hypothetical protein
VSGDDRPRVLVMTFNRTLSERAVRYAQFVASEGAHVDLVMADTLAAAEARTYVDHRVNVHSLLRTEHGGPITRFERRAVFEFPGTAQESLRRWQAGAGWRRPVGRISAGGLRVYERLALVFHGWIYSNIEKTFRPWLLSLRHEQRLAHIDCGSMERFVAGDISAIPLGWKLARRYPKILATTAMDSTPFSGPSPAESAAQT